MLSCTSYKKIFFMNSDLLNLGPFFYLLHGKFDLPYQKEKKKRKTGDGVFSVILNNMVLRFGSKFTWFFESKIDL